MGIVRVAGIDPSLRNTGLVIMDVHVEDGSFYNMIDLHLIRTEPSKNKSQRKSSADYQAASEIASTLRYKLDKHGARVVFAEVPSGAQSARASWSLGISLGIIASIVPAPIEVTPMQTKVHSIGIKTATKHEMIEWAARTYPDAPWLRKGDRLLNANEHLADAIGVVHAGLMTPEWNTVKSLLT